MLSLHDTVITVTHIQDNDHLFLFQKIWGFRRDSSGLWNHMNSSMDNNISKEHVPYKLYYKDLGSRFLQNTGNHLSKYMVT
jgi:hypothetical protein